MRAKAAHHKLSPALGARAVRGERGVADFVAAEAATTKFLDGVDFVAAASAAACRVTLPTIPAHGASAERGAKIVERAFARGETPLTQ
jgi:hypothetical protein